jgi:short-subunit dehydrogenase
MKNAIIVGSSSGIGRALARILASHGYTVGVTGRRIALLDDLAREIGASVIVKPMDVSKPLEAMQALRELIAHMRDVELFVISAGTGFPNPHLEWAPEHETIAVNVVGFAAIANVAAAHLQARGSGAFVGISSIGALRGNLEAPAYNASKAFMSNYLEALRDRFATLRLPIVVTDVQPGFVDTAMAKAANTFWMATPEKAAAQIYAAVRNRRRHVYVTKRWRLVAWIYKALPAWIIVRGARAARSHSSAPRVPHG